MDDNAIITLDATHLMERKMFCDFGTNVVINSKLVELNPDVAKTLSNNRQIVTPDFAVRSTSCRFAASLSFRLISNNTQLMYHFIDSRKISQKSLRRSPSHPKNGQAASSRNKRHSAAPAKQCLLRATR
jgi:hypothetical protein